MDDEHGEAGHGESGGNSTAEDVEKVEHEAEEVAESVEEISEIVEGFTGEGGGEHGGGEDGGEDAEGGGASTVARSSGVASNSAGVTARALDGLAGATGSSELRTAAAVSRTVGRVAQTVQHVAETVGALEREIRGGIERRSRRVAYNFHCEEVHDHWHIAHYELTDELNRPFEMRLKVSCDDREADPLKLLGQDVEVHLDRGDDYTNRVAGMVRRVVIEEESSDHHQSCVLDIVPALWALKKIEATRIFQEKTVPEIIETILTEHLEPYSREHDLEGLTETYVAREYCVQYRESALDFIQRLCEEEGIGFRFDCTEEGHEKLVFFDANRRLPKARTMDDAPVRFDFHARAVHGSEPLVQFHPAEQLGTTAYELWEHDWTKGKPRVTASAEGEDARGRSRQVYEHGFRVHANLTEYGSSFTYESNDVDRQKSIRNELFLRDARRAEGVSMVTGIAAGTVLDVSDHPTLGADGMWVVTKVVHSSRPHRFAGEGAHGAHHTEADYHNRIECIPNDVPYRPDRATRKPRIYGSQTARVVGPGGEEIHTDHHGRIKVQFHWDREGAYDEHSSMWMRVSQLWAGPHYPGFMFIPRIGMEVVVTFMDGDPDRPLVTGCVYNGENNVPDELDKEKTKSIIRTRSTPSSDGYNELSFEDNAGKEKVYIRAEKDFRELVQHDHDTHVQNCQSNTVDVDQTESVGRDQKIHVKRDRERTIDRNDKLYVKENRLHRVTGDETVIIESNRSTTIHQSETHIVETGSRSLEVQTGTDTETYMGGRSVHVHTEEVLEVAGGAPRSVHVTGTDDLKVDGKFHLEQAGTSHLVLDSQIVGSTAGALVLSAGDGAVAYEASAGGALALTASSTIEISASTKLKLKVGGSFIEITSSKITIGSSTVEIEGSSLVDVKSGGLVKLKC